jgi:hypothetical protein
MKESGHYQCLLTGVTGKIIQALRQENRNNVLEINCSDEYFKGETPDGAPPRKAKTSTNLLTFFSSSPVSDC